MNEAAQAAPPETLSTEDKEAALKTITEWSDKFGTYLEDAITRCIEDVGVSPVTRMELTKDGANVLFGAAVVCARANGMTVDELRALVLAIEEAQTGAQQA
jgi:hypothetical protein